MLKMRNTCNALELEKFQAGHCVDVPNWDIVPSEMVSDSMPALASANQYPHHHFQNHRLINACWQSWRWRWIVCQHQESLQLPITNGVGDQLNWLRCCVVTISPNYSITAKAWKTRQTKFCPYFNTTWNINFKQDSLFPGFSYICSRTRFMISLKTPKKVEDFLLLFILLLLCHHHPHEED